MIELQEHTSNPLGRKEAEELKGNGAFLLKRPLKIGPVPPEPGNIYQELKRSQLGINQVLSEENGNLAGRVEEQVTAVEKPVSSFIKLDNSTLRTKHERKIENSSDQCWPEGLPHLCSTSCPLNRVLLGFCFRR